MSTYIISGNTYEYRDQLRRAGARWDSELRCWRLEVVEHGFRRTDGTLYQLRRLPGLRIVEESRK